MRTTYEITEETEITVRVAPVRPLVKTVEGAHPNPTAEDFREAAARTASDAVDDLAESGFRPLLLKHERTSERIVREIKEKARADEQFHELLRLRSEVDIHRAIVDDEFRRLAYRARVNRFKANRLRAALR